MQYYIMLSKTIFLIEKITRRNTNSIFKIKKLLCLEEAFKK